MHPLRIAAATRCFAQPLKQAVQTASVIGVQGLEFDARNELRPSDLSETGRRQFLHQLDEMRLSVASLSLPTRRAFYIPEELDARVDAIKAAMTFAYQLRSKVVAARVGRVPVEADSDQYKLLSDVLNDLARHGNRVGSTLCITPTNDSPETLKRLLADISEGPIGISFDPAIFVMAGYKPADAFRTLYDSVLHVVIRDAIRDVDGGGVEVPVGRGEVEWDEMLALLGEADYDGWLTIERNTGDDKIGDISRAAAYVRNVVVG